jgi:AcrR family transcriptional regulator
LATGIGSGSVPTESRKTKLDLKREGTYRALLEAGLQTFAEKGYAAARIDDIVERTGQTRGAFYFHFKNKLELLEHLIADRAERRAGWPRWPDQLDPETPLPDVSAGTLAEVDRRIGGVGQWILVLGDAANCLRHDPEGAALLAAETARWIDEMTEVVEAVRRGGWSTSTAPAGDVAIQLFALGQGLSPELIRRLSDPRSMFEAYAKLLR